MFPDEMTWPGALVVAVALVLWAFNVHADRENRQELRTAVVEACASEAADEGGDVERCAVELRKAAEASD